MRWLLLRLFHFRHAADRHYFAEPPRCHASHIFFAISPFYAVDIISLTPPPSFRDTVGSAIAVEPDAANATPAVAAAARCAAGLLMMLIDAMLRATSV